MKPEHRFWRWIRKSSVNIQSFASDKTGSMAITFAVALVPIAMAVTAAVDFATATRIKASLQAAADAGVLAAATAMASGHGDSDKETIAKDTFYANLSPELLKAFPADPNVSVDFPAQTVHMDVQVDTDALLTNFITDSLTINVRAAARVDQGQAVCMMALNPTASEALSLNGTADLEANGCAVQVNSRHEEAMSQSGNSQGIAESFCIHGDYSGSNYTPKPRRYCTVEKDPLAEQFAADLAQIDLTNCRGDHPGTIDNQSGEVIMSPGVYCGGIKVKQGTLRLKPGVHVFRDGELYIQAQGTLIGEDVTVILTGDSSTRFVNQAGATVNLTAPSVAPFAGIVIAHDPGTVPTKDNTVIGGGYMKIEGIIYFPKQPLVVTGSGIIGEDAEQFAVIADTISLEGNGVLNITMGGNNHAAGLPKLPEANETVRLVK